MVDYLASWARHGKYFWPYIITKILIFAHEIPHSTSTIPVSTGTRWENANVLNVLSQSANLTGNRDMSAFQRRGWEHRVVNFRLTLGSWYDEYHIPPCLYGMRHGAKEIPGNRQIRLGRQGADAFIPTPFNNDLVHSLWFITTSHQTFLLGEILK